ncbi:MAG: histidinol-phosphate transaminase [Ruminococcus sp.]|nr:histidinol-phosphate transaminase [Ruminococcus sp.]
MKEYMNYLRKVDPYVPGEQPNLPNMIKLNTNENPYPPSPKVKEVWKQFSQNDLRLYPDPTSHKLNKAIADYYGLDESQVFTGVGSDDVLAMCFMTFFNSEKPILFPDITYSFYPVWAKLFDVKYEAIKLNENFCIEKEDYFKENGGIIFPNPNAPTGVELPLSEIEEILKHNPDSIVIADEAYIDFGGQSALSLLEKYDNLIIVQTFSKSRSMAGMRIGFAIGSPVLIKALHDVKYSFNSYTLNRMTIEIGAAAMADKAYFEETVQKIIETREWSKKEFKKLGFNFFDSKSNFIFVTHPNYNAKDLFLALRENNIFVRYFNADRINNYLRITIGTKKEMETLFDFLKSYIK